MTTAPGRETRSYKMDFSTVVGGARNCPIKGCRGQAATQMVMSLHFLHWHVRDTMIIMEEGNLPHQWCPQCDILVPWKSLNGQHVTTAQCAKGA